MKHFQIKNRLKVFLWILVSLFIGLIALTFALPPLLSTEKGKELALDMVNRHISGHLSIKKIDFHWLKGQRIEGFELKGKDGQDIASFQTFFTDSSLFSLLFGNLKGNTTLIAPHLQIIKSEKNSENQPSIKKERISKRVKHWIIPSIKGTLQVLDGEVIVQSKGIDPIKLSHIELDLKNPPFLFTLSGKTHQGGIDGNLLMNGNYHADTLYLVANISEFPLGLFDELKHTPLFSTAFGKTLSANVELEKKKEEMFVKADLKSKNMTGKVAGTSSQGIFSCDPTSQITFKVTPTFITSLFSSAHAPNWQLANKPEVVLNLHECTFPLQLKTLGWKDIQLLASLSIERVELTHEKLGHLSLNHFEAEAKTNTTLDITTKGQLQGNKASTTFKQEVKFTDLETYSFESNIQALPIEFFKLFSEKASHLSTLFGDHIDLTSKGMCEKGWLKSQLSFSSLHLQLDGTLEGDPKEFLDFNSQGRLIYSEKTKGVIGPAPELNLHMQFSMEEPFFIPMISAKVKNPYWDIDVEGYVGDEDSGFDLNNTYLTASGKLNKLPMEKSLKRDVTLSEGDLFLIFDGENNRITAHGNFATALSPFEKKRTAEITADIENFIHNDSLDFHNARILTKGSVEGFPLMFLNPFVPENVDIPTLLGPSISMDFTANRSSETDHRTHIVAFAKGEDLQAKLALKIDDNLTVTQDQPTLINWKMTPARYRSLMYLLYPERQAEFVLGSTVNVDFAIRHLSCPRSSADSLSAFLCQSGFDGDIYFGPLDFIQPQTREHITVVGMKVEVLGENFSKAIQFKAKGNIESPLTPPHETSGFSLQGEVLDLWTPEGNLNKEGLTLYGDLNLEYMPVKEFTGVLPLNYDTRRQLRALLGPLMNARIYGHISKLQGPLTVDIKSSNFKGLFPLLIGEKQIILQNTVQAEVTLNEEINEIYLKDIAPLLVTGVWSDHPVTVTVDPNGFSIPIRPYSFRDLSIHHAVIDLGKIRVRNGGDIQNLMDFLKAQEVSDEGVMEAWFTPIFMSLNQGVATYQRFDVLLAGSVHIAFWGNINLIKDKVRMTLGIAPSTLKHRFNIKGLPKNDMFQVKMRGSTSHLDLDWGSASTRIGIIVARSAIGHLGIIVGTLLDQIVKALGEEPTPPPTTYPFPWGQN